MKKYKFFWKGILSNWAKSKFRIFDIGVTFNSGEQYMMYQKAMLFNDVSTANKILNSNNPRIIKQLGREVINFNSEIWDDLKYDILKFGLKNRFEQDLIAKSELLKYKGCIFVEASPFDRIWGIGFDEENALNNIDNWGENLLGKILTELSLEIM